GTSGIVENVVEVDSLSLAACNTLAQQLVTRNKTVGPSLKFTTRRQGLAIGQALSVFWSARGINDQVFLIERVTTRVTTESALGALTAAYWYDVEASTSPNLGSWVNVLK